jgi:Ca2+-binding RTX toxin-like protein
VTVNLATLTGQNTAGAGTDTLSNFENLMGSIYNDTLTGDGNANVIEGGAGNDTINGAGGIDTLSYFHAGSAVTINLATTSAQNTVGAGTDTISNFENLTGSAYGDTLTGDGNANVIQGGDGNDTINGAGGTDTLSYVGATAAVTVDLSTATAQNTVGAGTDTIPISRI